MVITKRIKMVFVFLFALFYLYLSFFSPFISGKVSAAEYKKYVDIHRGDYVELPDDFPLLKHYIVREESNGDAIIETSNSTYVQALGIFTHYEDSQIYKLTEDGRWVHLGYYEKAGTRNAHTLIPQLRMSSHDIKSNTSDIVFLKTTPIVMNKGVIRTSYPLVMSQILDHLLQTFSNIFYVILPIIFILFGFRKAWLLIRGSIRG